MGYFDRGTHERRIRVWKQSRGPDAHAEKIPDYVYVLNPDTEVRPGAIGSLVRFLEASPQVGIAGGNFEHLDGRIWPIAFRFPTIFSELSHGLQIGIVSRLLRRWTVAWPMIQLTQPIDWICGAAMMIRPAVFDRIGGFDENYFLYFEETDFCNRARRAGYATWYVPESRVMHIMGQSTKVTDEKAVLQRFPAYWFQSRRRYFAVTFGVLHAMVIDLIAVLANSLGLMKRLALRRPSVPYYIRDLISHSVLWPRNRIGSCSQMLPPRAASLLRRFDPRVSAGCDRGLCSPELPVLSMPIEITTIGGPPPFNVGNHRR